MIYDIWRLSTEKNGFGGAAFLNIPFHACIDIQKVCNIWYIYLHMIFGSRLTRQAVDHGSWFIGGSYPHNQLVDEGYRNRPSIVLMGKL